MAYDNQQQRPQFAKKGALAREAAEAIADLSQKEPLGFTTDEVLLIWDVCPDPCLMSDFKRFVYIASAKGLNPILNDLHLEYRFDRDSGGPKAAIVTHQDGLLKIAHRSKMLDGIVPVQGKDERGFYVETSVHKKECKFPFVFRAYMSEFNQGRGVWGRMEYNMLAKCSRAGALRIAFPEETAGIYEAEEMANFADANDGPEPAAAEKYAIGEKPAPEVVKITPAEPAILSASPAPEVPANSNVFTSTLAVPTPALAAVASNGAAAAPAPSPAQAVAATVAAIESIPEAAKAMPPAGYSISHGLPEADARKQYAARLKVIITSAVWGVTKAEMDKVVLGYFGVTNKNDLPKDPAQFLKVLDDTIQQLSEGGAAALKQDPISYGAILAGRALLTPTPQPAANPAGRVMTAETAAAGAVFQEIKAKFPAWKDDLCMLATRVIVKHDAEVESIVTIVTSDLMAKYTEPMIETFLTIGFYDVDGAMAILKRRKEKGDRYPMMWFQKEIEKNAGPIGGKLDADPMKVMEGVGKALAAAV